MLKFKVGETVIVREDIADMAIDGVYNLYSGITDLAGQEVTISGAYQGKYGPRYLIEGYGRTFLEDFFVSEKEEFQPEGQIKGFARKLDDLGRITIPVEYRKAIELEILESLSMNIINKVIHLKKGKGRKLDKLGRYTIPIEFRRSLGIGCSDLVDIFVNGNEICVKKISVQCAMCGSTENQLVIRNNVCVCTECIEELAVHIERVEETL